MKLPAGLTNNEIEFFSENGEVYFIRKGAVAPLSDLDEFTLSQIENHITDSVDRELRKTFGLNDRMDKIKKFVACRLGNFDFEPDMINGQLQDEAPNCPLMDDRKAFGKVCMIPEAPGGKITKMEFKIIRYVSKGFMPKEIANILCIAEATVRTHIQRIHAKLFINNNQELTKWAVEKRIG